MQHKVVVSALLKIATANNKPAQLNDTNKNLTKALASEALESLKNCDVYTSVAIEENDMMWIY